MVLDESNTNELYSQFEAIHENSEAIKQLKEDVKELSGANKDLFKTIAETFSVEVSDVSDTYKYWVRLKEEGQDSLETITSLFEAIKTKMAEKE